MAEETIRLARYAAALRYEDLPTAVVQQAKDCIIDTVAAGNLPDVAGKMLFASNNPQTTLAMAQLAGNGEENRYEWQRQHWIKAPKSPEPERREHGEHEKLTMREVDNFHQAKN